MGGIEGDGDIFNPENQAEFIKFVKSHTEDKGVYFVMADGVSVHILDTQKHRFVTIYPSNKVTEFDRSDINVIACGVLVHVG